MKLKLTRDLFAENYPTIGKLEIDGKFFCSTLEDEDRGLDQSMPPAEIQKIKVYGKTAIPTGKYKVQVTPSPKFKRPLPSVTPVKGFLGIRIHRGNKEEDSLGCILVGFGRPSNTYITDSRKAEDALVKLLGKDIHDLEILKK
jgi:hypothetical protein